MPTLFLHQEEINVANRQYYLFSLDSVNATITVSLTSLQTLTWDFISPIWLPNNNNVTTAAGDLQIIHTVTNKSITVQPQLHRVNQGLTIQSSGTAATAVTTAATNLFSALDEPTWSTTCTDRLMVRLTYVNTAKSTQSCTLGVDRSDCYLYTTIPFNTQGCRDTARNFVHISYKK